MAYGCVVFDPNGLVLMIREGPAGDDGVWSFPKGQPQGHESTFDTALRETWAETGVLPTNLWME
eukprot:5682371-Alexandrium_andersonii.AAC.1